MGLLDVASGKSVWRGYDYYENNNVVSWEQSGTDIYDGVVLGSEGNRYTVHVDKVHPKRSTCNCPFADGRRVVCKHMIAVYFTAEPDAAEAFIRQVQEWEEEEELLQEQCEEDLRDYVYSLSKDELREELLDALMELAEHDRWR